MKYDEEANVVDLSLQIYQLPDWRLVFLVKNFPVGQRVLVDSSSGQSAAQGEGKKEEVTRQGEIPLVKEVSLVSLGNNRSRPYLLVGLSLDFFLIYMRSFRDLIKVLFFRFMSSRSF